MQILLNGLITGAVIALLAMAFSMVYLPTRVFHVALGGIYVVTPYIVVTCSTRGWSPWLAVLFSLITGLLLSLGCEFFNHARLERRKASAGTHLVSSLGIYISLLASVSLIWGNEIMFLRTGMDRTVAVSGIVLSHSQLVAVVVSAFLLTAFFCWLRFTNLGLQLRALAENPTEFALRGYNVRVIRLLAFGVSGVLGSSSSLLVGYDVGFDPHGGLSALLLAVVAVIIGGRQSFVGPVFGAVLLGLIRSEVVWFFSAKWQDAVTFLLLAAFLYLRPLGLVGQKARLESQE